MMLVGMMVFTQTRHQVHSAHLEVRTNMEFLRSHVGYFDVVDGGFQMGASWGFIIGIGVMLMVLKVLKEKNKRK